MEEAQEWLIEVQMAHIVQSLDEEARVQQMQNGMLDAADILIDRLPQLHHFWTPRLLTVMWIGIAQVIPGRADEGIHRVGFTGSRTAADGTGGIQKLRLIAQWRLAG